jgi:tetratricopeptide (TPR) repeat protein
VLMFGGTLFPAIGFVNVYPFRYSFVADHFQYHASLGIIVLVGSWLALKIPARVGLPIAVVVLGLFGVRTWQQTHKYEGKEVLYNSILDDNPNGWFAHNNLAAIYTTREEWQRGFDLYVKTKRLHPILAPEATPEAYAHCMVADMIAKTWSLKPAIDAVRRSPAQVIALRDPVMPYVNMARSHFEKSIQLSPKYDTPLLDLGTLMRGLGAVTIEVDPTPIYRVAVQSWARLLKLKPEDGNHRARLHNLHLYLADFYDRLKRGKEADAHRIAARNLRMADPNPRRN